MHSPMDPHHGPLSPQQQPPQVSLSFDEAQESEYSTPNSRGRRVIREIVV